MLTNFRKRLLVAVYLVAVVATSVGSTFVNLPQQDCLAADKREPSTCKMQENILAPVPTPIESSEPQKRVIVANCSAYTASPDECGGNDTGITASGKKAIEGVTVAMDDVPLGTKIRIDGHEYIVEDRFGGGYTNRVDIFFNNKEDALRFGRQHLEVEILG